MFKNRWAKRCLVLFIFYFLCFYVFPLDAFARVSGGRSSGSRGSRSSTPPRSSSAPKQAQPTPPPSQQLSQPTPQPQSSFLRGVMGGVMGGILGGMLFRSLGFGGDMATEGGSGIGLFEIFLIGALLFGVYWYIKRRRQAALANAYYQSSMGTAEPSYQPSPSYGQSYEQPRGEEGDLGKGLGYIRQMDSSFDEKKFQDLCMDHFFKIQGAWTNRDLSGVRNLLTEEMSRIIQDDVEKLKSERKINKLENIAVRSVDLVEAWQESGRDYITVKLYANLLDFTIDETTDKVISGNKTEPVKFEEYWTFTRPVGNKPWQLSAIQQVE